MASLDTSSPWRLAFDWFHYSTRFPTALRAGAAILINLYRMLTIQSLRHRTPEMQHVFILLRDVLGISLPPSPSGQNSLGIHRRLTSFGTTSACPPERGSLDSAPTTLLRTSACMHIGEFEHVESVNLISMCSDQVPDDFVSSPDIRFLVPL